MEVEPDFYIDAADSKNLIKFVNHSCDPNTEICKRKKGKAETVVLEALRPIKRGEELTFKYCLRGNFMPLGERIRCVCGAENCRGWL